MTFKQALARATELAQIASTVTVSPNIAIVWHEQRKAWAFYNADAWIPGHGLLPWKPPPYPAVAIVQPDGIWRQA